MADKKITQLTNITGANLVDADEFVVVDISADETKAITLGELKEAFDSGSGFVRITGDTMTGDLGFGDNDKAIFGAGSDLQIFHNGIDSYIQEAGTGRLYIRGSDSVRIQAVLGSENMAIFNENGSVQLYHDNSEKLETTSTGIDVTGTVTADGLTVDGLSIGGIGGLEIEDPSASGYGAHFSFYDASSEVVIGGKTAGSTNKSLSIGRDTGDISFYEATGTTPKFFWDASAESLGIGVGSSVGEALHVKGVGRFENSNATPVSVHINSGNHDYGQILASTSSAWKNLVLNQYGGNVGIGVTDPDSALEVQSSASGSNSVHLSNTSSTGYGAKFVGGGNTSTRYIADFRDYSGASKLRLDGDGNLLVGKTSAGLQFAGTELAQSGFAFFTRDGGAPVQVNRTGVADGALTEFHKNGATVGSIGVDNTDNLTISGNSTHAGLNFSTSDIIPYKNGDYIDDDINLGFSDYRFKDLYLSGGIQFDSRSNKLDDYEEGTWTPVIRGNSSAGSATYATQTGTYTKVGRTVTFEFAVVWSGHTGTGSIEIGGFPFNAGTQTYYLVQTENISLTSGSISFTSRIDASDNYGLLIQTPTGGGVRAAVPMDAAGDIRGVGTYQTA